MPVSEILKNNKLRIGLGIIVVVEILAAVFLVSRLSVLTSPEAKSESPKPDTNTPLVSFTAAGDFGASETTKKVLQTAANQKPDFMLALGDFGYNQTKNEAEWCGFIHAALGDTFPFMLIAGNHDVEGDSGFGNGHFDRYAACLPNRMPNMRGTYGEKYFFDQGNTARIIGIAPNLNVYGTQGNYNKGGDGYVWLSDAIDNARQKKISWLVVAMHENCIAIGVKKCEIGEDVLNLMVEKRVDLILQGHEHGYMRSSQLSLNSTCASISASSPKAECVITSAENTYQKGLGPLLVINGTGGFDVRDINLQRAEKIFFANWHGKNIEPTNGPTSVKIYNDRLVAEYLGVDGKVQDSFTVVR